MELQMNEKRTIFSPLRKISLKIIGYTIFLMLLGCYHTQNTFKITPQHPVEELLSTFSKNAPVYSATFNPRNNAQVALGTENGMIYLYNAINHSLVRLAFNKNNIFDIAFSSNGLLLATTSYNDNTVFIWDVARREIIQTIPLKLPAIKIAFSPDDQILAIATTIQTNNAQYTETDIIMWDIAENRSIMKLRKHIGGVSAITFSRKNGWLISAGMLDKQIYIWQWEKGELLQTHDLVETPTAIALSPDEQWLVVGSHNGSIQRWHLATKHPTQGKTLKNGVHSLLITNDMKYLISSSYSNDLIVQDFSNISSAKYEMSNTTQSISKVALSSDNTKLAVSLYDGSMQIYDFQSKQLQHLLIVSKKDNEWLSCDYTKQQCVKNTPPFDWIKFLKSYLGIIITGTTFLVFMLLLFYVRIYKHPLVLQLSNSPQDLLKLPLQQLPEAKKLLRLTRRLNTVLARCEISHTTFNHAVSFLYATPKQQAQILSQSLMSTSESISTHVFLVKFTTLRLNLDNCLFYFPESHLLASDILQQLEYQEIFRDKKVIIITTALEKQQALRPYGENLHNEWIIPNAFELTQLLLSATPVETFSRLLSTQLSLIKISPYQISGALRKDESFFGRTSIISDILSRHFKNYLVVGGRQIGKSSLLQYLYRKLSKRNDINAFYYQYLYGENIIQRLAIYLGLEEDSSVEQVMNYLTTVSKPCIFLLDETDGLIETDKQLGYFNLHQLRSLSANGNCYFILAGVWYLYQSAMSEYASPLKNFGELITLAELEHSACYDLIVKPLNALGISFASKSLVDDLIQQTGQRANLIALVCNEIVRQVDKTTPIIDEPMLRYVLCHHNIQEMFGTQTEQTLDKIIMYLTVQKDKFTLEDISSELIKYHYSPTITEIKNALKRLTLELVLKELEQQTYKYAIPLMRENLLKYDLAALIDELTTTVSFDEEV